MGRKRLNLNAAERYVRRKRSCVSIEAFRGALLEIEHEVGGCPAFTTSND